MAVIQILPFLMMNWEASVFLEKNGEKISIIEDGRFVLAGTEELNKPLRNKERILKSNSKIN